MEGERGETGRLRGGGGGGGGGVGSGGGRGGAAAAGRRDQGARPQLCGPNLCSWTEASPGSACHDQLYLPGPALRSW